MSEGGEYKYSFEGILNPGKHMVTLVRFFLTFVIYNGNSVSNFVIKNSLIFLSETSSN